jgi:hypothetical protein
MKTLTVRLPEALVSQIEHESRARGLSKSDIVRERLTRAGSVDPKLPAPTCETLLENHRLWPQARSLMLAS